MEVTVVMTDKEFLEFVDYKRDKTACIAEMASKSEKWEMLEQARDLLE